MPKDVGAGDSIRFDFVQRGDGGFQLSSVTPTKAASGKQPEVKK